MIGKKGGHLLGNATPLASMAGPVLRQQLSHGGGGWWVLKKFYLMAKVPLSKSMRSWTVAESVGASDSSGYEKGLLIRGAAEKGLLL